MPITPSPCPVCKRLRPVYHDPDTDPAACLDPCVRCAPQDKKSVAYRKRAATQQRNRELANAEQRANENPQGKAA